MTRSDGWTCLADELGLEGQGLLWADAALAESLAERARSAGYRVLALDTAGVLDFRTAQRQLAQTLRLAGNAGTNLDALSDSLRDLAREWPQEDRLALFWRHPEALIAADTAGWFRLAQVLDEASGQLWHGEGDEQDRLFETVLLIDGFDG